MKPNIKAGLMTLGAITLYGGMSATIEQKLASIHPLRIMAWYLPVMLLLTWAFLGRSKLLGTFPVGPPPEIRWLLVIIGICYFFADRLFFGAFSTGGSVMLIASICVMMPVMASLSKCLIFKGSVPNVHQIVAFVIIAGGAIYATWAEQK